MPHIQMFTVCDYLDVLLTLCQVSSSVQSMARYLSEGVLLHPVLTRYTYKSIHTGIHVYKNITLRCRFSSAHLAAACLLNAQILLEQGMSDTVHVEVYAAGWPYNHCFKSPLPAFLSPLSPSLLLPPLPPEYPWSVHMEEATGFTLSSLCRCCLMIYHRWSVDTCMYIHTVSGAPLIRTPWGITLQCFFRKFFFAQGAKPFFRGGGGGGGKYPL